MGPSVGSPTGWTRLAAPEPSWLDSRVGHVFPAISGLPGQLGEGADPRSGGRAARSRPAVPAPAPAAGG